MRGTGKLVTTAAIVGAAAGIYAYQQVSKAVATNAADHATNDARQNNSTTNCAPTITHENIPHQTFTTTNSSDYGTTGSTGTVQTKAATGYTTIPIYTSTGSEPITNVTVETDDDTISTSTTIDME